MEQGEGEGEVKQSLKNIKGSELSSGRIFIQRNICKNLA
jgi:hypothetical protein